MEQKAMRRGSRRRAVCGPGRRRSPSLFFVLAVPLPVTTGARMSESYAVRVLPSREGIGGFSPPAGLRSSWRELIARRSTSFQRQSSFSGRAAHLASPSVVARLRELREPRWSV